MIEAAMTGWLLDRAAKDLHVHPQTEAEWRQYMGILRHARAVEGMTIRKAAYCWNLPPGALVAELVRYRDECIRDGLPPMDLLFFDPPEVWGPLDRRTPEEIAEHAEDVRQRDLEARLVPRTVSEEDEVAASVQVWLNLMRMDGQPFRAHEDVFSWMTYLDVVMRERARHGHSIARVANDRGLPPEVVFEALCEYRDELVEEGREPEWLILDLDPPALIAPWDPRTPEEITEDEPARQARQREVWQGSPPSEWLGQPWW